YLKCTCDDHHLLSFPTRRSSDLYIFPRLPLYQGSRNLRVQKNDGARSSGSNTDELEERFEAVDGGLTSGSFADGDEQALLQKDRSEEHTSELQSREKLVCRLLLE